jgi:hypothetical protein
MRLGTAKTAREQAKSPDHRRLQFHKSRQLFIRTHNETLSVVTVRVSNEDCSPARIHGCNAATHGKRHRRYCRQYQNYRLHIYRRKKLQGDAAP